RHYVERYLRVRDIAFRVGLCAQILVLDVPDHTDDLAHHWLILLRRDARLDALADGVFAGEELLRERFVDDDDARRVCIVALGEITPLDDGDAHRAEVVWIDRAKLKRGQLALRERATFSLKRDA